MEGLKNLTYELPSTNILNQVTLEHQYTHSMIKNNTHLRFFFFNFFHSFFFLFNFFSFLFFIFFIFFFYIYKNVHTLNMNKISPKDDINNG